MKNCIFLALLYLVPVFLMWLYWVILYSKYGKEHGGASDPYEHIEAKTIFIPLMNIFAVIMLWVGKFPFKRKSKYRRPFMDRILLIKKRKD